MLPRLDSTRAYRSPDDLHDLVEAVYNGHVYGEQDWIEWKSQLDLTTAHGLFKIGKAVLSFANREPDVAQLKAEGAAYLVVGVEPRTTRGITPIDPSRLRSRLNPFLGPSGPAWGHDYVSFSGYEVLVVIVEPPRWGDPIYPLRKGYDDAPDGLVLVRRGASSEPATSREIDMLVQRARGGRMPGLTVQWAEPTAVFYPIDDRPELRDLWLGRERERLESFQRSRPRVTLLEPPTAIEIDKWCTKAENGLIDAVTRAVLETGENRCRLRIINPTERNLPATELRLRLPPGVRAADPDHPEDYDYLPRRPKQRSVAGFDSSLLARPLDLAPPLPRNLDIRPASDHRAVQEVVFDPIDLRPHCEVELDVICLVPPASTRGTLAANWSATSTAVDGAVRGSLPIEVSPNCWSLDLLDENEFQKDA